MPTRIYAFAKELGLDNKSLLDICEQANIKGKGSALASLDDDEITIIRDYLQKNSAPSEPEPSPLGLRVILQARMHTISLFE